MHGVDIRCWQTENVPAEIAGLATGKGDGTGTTSEGHVLAGDVTGKGIGTGTTSEGHVLAGLAMGKGDSTGDEDEGHSIVGDILGAGRSSGSMSSHLSIIGLAIGKGDGTGTTSEGHALAGDVTGKGIGTGTTSEGHVLAGDVTGKGIGTGTTSEGHVLAGLAIGKGDSTAAYHRATTTNCTKCSTGTPKLWVMVVAGMTGNNSTFNGTFGLNYASGCIWTGSVPPASWSLSYNAGTNIWSLVGTNATNTITYALPGPAYNCLGPNAMIFSTQIGTGSHPGTITLS